MRSLDDDDFGSPIPFQKERGHSIRSKPREATTSAGFDDKTVKEVFDYYRPRWEKKYGTILVITSYAAALTLIRDVLRAAGGDKRKVLHMVDIYLSDDRPYYRQTVKHSLEIFKKDCQRLAAATAEPEPVAAPPVRVRAEVRCPLCGDEFVLICNLSKAEIEETPCGKCKQKGNQ